MKIRLIGLVVLVMAAIQAAPAQEVKPSSIVQALEERGFKKCGVDLDRWVKWVHKDDSRHAYLNIWNTTAPDQRTAMALTSQTAGDVNSVTTFTASPDVSGKCSVSFSQVWSFSDSCTVMRDEVFKAWVFIRALGPSAMYEEKDNKMLTVLLTPAHTGGCLVLKTGMVY